MEEKKGVHAAFAQRFPGPREKVRKGTRDYTFEARSRSKKIRSRKVGKRRTFLRKGVRGGKAE